MATTKRDEREAERLQRRYEASNPKAPPEPEVLGGDSEELRRLKARYPRSAASRSRTE